MSTLYHEVNHKVYRKVNPNSIKGRLLMWSSSNAKTVRVTKKSFWTMSTGHLLLLSEILFEFAFDTKSDL